MATEAGTATKIKLEAPDALQPLPAAEASGLVPLIPPRVDDGKPF